MREIISGCPFLVTACRLAGGQRGTSAGASCCVAGCYGWSIRCRASAASSAVLAGKSRQCG